MHSDGSPLPNLSETAVLHSVGVIRTDQLPGLAARWLAADLVDTEAVRMLAGHGRHDPWALEELLRDALDEAHAEPPREPLAVRNVLASYVAARWRHDRDTQGAVVTLARLGESEPDLDLGPFIGLADEWTAGWGRPMPELQAAAETELERYLVKSPPALESIQAMARRMREDLGIDPPAFSHGASGGPPDNPKGSERR